MDKLPPGVLEHMVFALAISFGAGAAVWLIDALLDFLSNIRRKP